MGKQSCPELPHLNNGRQQAHNVGNGGVSRARETEGDGNEDGNESWKGKKGKEEGNGRRKGRNGRNGRC